MGSKSKTTTTQSHTVNKKSSSKRINTTSNRTKVIDKSNTVDDGTQILDSVIVDPSDKVMTAAIASMEAAFEDMSRQDTVRLGELLGLGEELLDYVDTGQVRLADAAYKTLTEGVDLLRDVSSDGTHVIDFGADATNQVFDLAEQISDGNADVTGDVLEILGDVQGGTQVELIQSITFAMLILSLGAILLSRKDLT